MKGQGWRALTSTHHLGVQERSPLPEREVASLAPSFQSGPQVRQKHDEWMSVESWECCMEQIFFDHERGKLWRHCI